MYFPAKYDRIFLEPSCFPYTFQFDSIQVKVKCKHELFFFFNNHFEIDECISGGKNPTDNSSFNCHFEHCNAISLIPQQNALLLK